MYQRVELADGRRTVIIRYEKSDNLANMYFKDEIVNAIPDHGIPVESTVSRNSISSVQD